MNDDELIEKMSKARRLEEVVDLVSGKAEQDWLVAFSHYAHPGTEAQVTPKEAAERDESQEAGTSPEAHKRLQYGRIYRNSA